MYRALICSLFVVLIGVSTVRAEEIEGKLKAVDTDKSTVTLTVGGKDETFKVLDSTKLLDDKGKAIKLKSPAFKPGVGIKALFLCNELKSLTILDASPRK
jgi:hypothetical protein